MANMIRARQRAGMSQTELAKRVQARGVPCHQQTIARIESGSRSIRLNEAQELTEILFLGDWDAATQAAGAGALASALEEDIKHSLLERSRLSLAAASWAELSESTRVTLVADLERYMLAAEAEAVAFDEGLIARAKSELRAWSEASSRRLGQLRGRHAGEGEDEWEWEPLNVPGPSEAREGGGQRGEHPEA